MSKLFTELVGLPVCFTEHLHAPLRSPKQIYCVYEVKPMKSIRVIQADALLLASFAGALIGLSPEVVKVRMATVSIDEGLKDPLCEVMNIASRIVSLQNDVVFKNLFRDSGGLPPEARYTLRNPCYCSHFDVTIDGYTGGAFSLFAPV